MDTFFEQLVSIKKTAKTWLALFGITIAALILSIVAFLFLGSFGLLISAAIFYGAYRLYMFLFIEYEYIITNGTMDVDKIIAKSSRKREMSFELSSVVRLEKYNINARPVGNFKKTVIACNEDDPSAYFMVTSEEGSGTKLLVFTPDERIKSAIVKFVPKHIGNSAFK